VRQGVVVDRAPIPTHEGRDKQQQGAMWLVEVGDHTAYDLELVPRRNDDLCGGPQAIHPAAIEVAKDGPERLLRRQPLLRRPHRAIRRPASHCRRHGQPWVQGRHRRIGAQLEQGSGGHHVPEGVGAFLQTRPHPAHGRPVVNEVGRLNRQLDAAAHEAPECPVGFVEGVGRQQLGVLQAPGGSRVREGGGDVVDCRVPDGVDGHLVTLPGGMGHEVGELGPVDIDHAAGVLQPQPRGVAGGPLAWGNFLGHDT